MNTKKITTLSLMAAISILLVLLIRFPIFPAAPFLEYDPADIPILITAFAFGPIEGLLLCAVVSLVQGITVSAASGVIGIVMHILSTGAFVLTAGGIYQHNKTRKNALLALAVGSIVMAGVMCILNLILTPIFMNTERSVVQGMLISTILPFNLLKACLNSAVTFILYKKISNYIKEKEIA